MKSLNYRCEKCGNAVSIHAGQQLVNDRIYWSISYNCGICDTNIEEDGADITPQDIRKIILNLEGEWNLTIEDNVSNAAEILKVLKQALNLSMADTLKVKKNIPGNVMNGTKVEMLRLQILLQKCGISSEVTERN